MKISFILPVYPDAHPQHRMDALLKEDVTLELEMLAFERTGYYPGTKTSIPIHMLGHITHRDYLSRPWIYLKAMKKIRHHATSTDVIYIFGFDLVVAAWLACLNMKHKPAFVYEIPDIRELMVGDSILARLVRTTMRWAITRIDLLVVTSKSFLTGFFQGYANIYPNNTLVIENKARRMARHPPPESGPAIANPENLIIGYFGVLRCRRSLEILIEVAKQPGIHINIILHGIFVGTDDLRKIIEETPNIEYCGSFTSPDDLPSMYSSVDLVWTCYPFSEEPIGNWNWAQTNRFYECCYYGKPMFTWVGTVDANAVGSYNIGLTLPLQHVDASVKKIAAVSLEQISKWKTNLRKLPENVYLYTDEHKRLLSKLQELQ